MVKHDIKPVPDDLHPDCNDCNYFLLAYDREDLYQAYLERLGSTLAGYHILPSYGAMTKMEKKVRNV